MFLDVSLGYFLVDHENDLGIWRILYSQLLNYITLHITLHFFEMNSNFDALKSTRISETRRHFFWNSFTMVEENFEFWFSEITKN